jgi:hypothetical protein
VAAGQLELTEIWRISASPEEAFDVLFEIKDFPRWWPASFISAREIQGGDEAGIGRVVSVETRARLPGTLAWQLNVTAADRPHWFEAELWGDLGGTIRWSILPAADGSDVRCDLKILYRKPGTGALWPLIRQLFAAGMRWTLARGRESLELELARRRAADEAERRAVAAPPQPDVLPIGLYALLGLAGIAALTLVRGRVRKARRR